MASYPALAVAVSVGVLVLIFAAVAVWAYAEHSRASVKKRVARIHEAQRLAALQSAKTTAALQQKDRIFKELHKKRQALLSLQQQTELDGDDSNNSDVDIEQGLTRDSVQVRGAAPVGANYLSVGATARAPAAGPKGLLAAKPLDALPPVPLHAQAQPTSLSSPGTTALASARATGLKSTPASTASQSVAQSASNSIMSSVERLLASDRAVVFESSIALASKSSSLPKSQRVCEDQPERARLRSLQHTYTKAHDQNDHAVHEWYAFA
jgi:hypothetical protein